MGRGDCGGSRRLTERQGVGGDQAACPRYRAFRRADTLGGYRPADAGPQGHTCVSASRAPELGQLCAPCPAAVCRGRPVPAPASPQPRPLSLQRPPSASRQGHAWRGQLPALEALCRPRAHVGERGWQCPVPAETPRLGGPFAAAEGPPWLWTLRARVCSSNSVSAPTG